MVKSNPAVAMAAGFFALMRAADMEYQTVLEAVRAWPIENRVRLVDQIQDDLHVSDENLTPELMQELDRRLADLKANPADVTIWEEIMSKATSA